MKWYQFRIHVVLLTSLLVFWLTNPLLALKDYDKPMGVNPLPPCIIIYTEDIPGGERAASKGSVCYIKPKDKNDLSIVEHELTHCRQFWLSCGLNIFLYQYSDKFRLMYELEAFKESLKHEPMREKARVEYAYLLSKKYNLEKIIDFEIVYYLLGDK